MPTYILLIKLTDQGSKDIKATLKDQEQALKMGEKMGVKFLGVYTVMGEYDVVVIFECPSDEVALTGILSASASGNIRTTTLRAFTQEEFREIVDKMP